MIVRIASAVLETILLIFLLNASSVCFGNDIQCGKTFYTEEGIVEPLGKWPWLVTLHGTDNNYIASGSIISQWFVLTAAQVTYLNGNVPMKPNELEVMMGLTDLSNLHNYTRKSNVSHILRYDNYDQQTRMNDLALLKVETIIEFSPYISSICLWPSVGPSLAALANQGLHAFVIGSKRDEKGDVKHVLRETNISASKVKKCSSDLLLDWSKIRNYCVSSSGEDFDNGSGLYFQLDGVWHVRGIFSHRPMTVEAKDEVMLDITYYQKWIEKHALPKQHNLLGLDDCGMGIYSESNDSEKNILVANHHPWIAHLAYLFWDRFNVSDCHAVLIHPEFVVTSSKCTDVRKYRELQHVILGDRSIGKDPYSSNKNNIQAIKVSEHLFSQGTKSSDEIFDINVLRLAKNVILTDTVKPVCLSPAQESVPYYSLTGWYRGDEHPKELKTSLMQFIPFDQCQSMYLEKGVNFTSEDYVACFESCKLSEKAEADGSYKCVSSKPAECSRALSASPIFYTKHDGVNTYTYLAGVKSFGSADCHDGLHDVFNDIVSFGSWIETLVDEKAWFTDDEDHLLHEYEPVGHTIHFEWDEDGNLINEDGDDTITYS